MLVQLLYMLYFLCYHKYTKIQNNYKITSMEKNILGGHPVALVGEAKDFHQHHIWCFPWPCSGEKISLNAAHIPCNDQLWCPHMQRSWHPTETSDRVVYDHILSTSMLKKTILLLLPLLSFHVQQNSPNNEADIIPDNNIIRRMWSN